MAALTQLQIITATDGAGTNCHHRALAALALFPQLRAVIGTLLLRGCRDLRTGRPVPWAHRDDPCHRLGCAPRPPRPQG